MPQDLDHLIALQQLETAAEEARRLVVSTPQRIDGLDAHLAAAEAALATAREQKALGETERRALEKDLAAVRTRRSKFLDQTIEVKTNREYHALQHEIQMADEEIKRLEDRILENMLALDDIGASISNAEGAQKEAERSVTEQKRTLEAERHRAEDSLEEIARERQALVVEDLARSIRRLRYGLPGKKKPGGGVGGRGPLQRVPRPRAAADRSGCAAPRPDRAVRELHPDPVSPYAAGTRRNAARVIAACIDGGARPDPPNRPGDVRARPAAGAERRLRQSRDGRSRGRRVTQRRA